MSQPIVLLLLRVPVQLINVFTTVAGTICYAPSYLMFLLIQGIIFGPYAKFSLSSYLMTWPLRFLLLVGSFTLFLGQFGYLIYYGITRTDETNRYILAASLAISVPGIIYLMRRGYLKALRYFKVPQLKSPMEYAGQLLQLLADLPSILLTILNIALLKNIFKTFEFQYSATRRTYLPHIGKLVSTAFFYDLERVFVWYLTVFSWRLNASEDYKKEKDHNMHRLAILFLLTVNTFADTVVFLLAGWMPFLSAYCSHRRYVKLIRFGRVEDYRKYVISYSLLAFGQFIETICLTLSACLVVNFKLAVFYFKKSREWTNILNEVYPHGQLWQARLKQNSSLVDSGELEMIARAVLLVLLTLLQIALFGFRIVVYLTVYKEKKLQLFLKKREQQRQEIAEKKEQALRERNPAHKTSADVIGQGEFNIDFEYQWKLPAYTFEFLYDMLFMPLVLITALLRPWSFRYYFRIIDEEYNFKHQLILKRLLKAIVFYICAILGVALLPLYMHRLRWIVNYWKTTQLPEEEQKFKFQHVFVKVMGQMFRDLPHLPLYYIMMASGTYLFRSKEQPKELLDFKNLAVNYNDYMHQMVALAYMLKLRLTGRYARFETIFNLDREQYIKSVYDKRVFWTTASRIVSRESMVRMMRLLIVATRYRLGPYEEEVKRIKQQPDPNGSLPNPTSQIGQELHKAKTIFMLTIDNFVGIIIEIIIGIVVVFVLIPLTTWRFPTLVFLYRNEKRYEEIGGHARPEHRILCLVGFILKQQFVDLLLVPAYLVAFVTCPLRFIKYCYREAYNYKNQDYTITFAVSLDQGRDYFMSAIFAQSVRNFFSVFELIGVFLTVVRAYYCYKLVRKAKHNFRKFFAKVIGIHPDPTFEEYLENRYRPAVVKPQSEKISLRMCIHVSFRQAIKDIPFAVLSLLILVLFPWRFYYLWAVIKVQHERMPIAMRDGKINVAGRRRQILQLMWNIIKTDFVCIFLNTLLLLSVYKFRRGVELLVNNFKRNLMKGFLSYNYQRDLICEIKLMWEDSKNFFRLLLIIAMVVRIRPTVRRVLQLRKQRQAKAKQQAYNKFIYETTLKAGKEEQLTNIGFFAFQNICSYLQPNDLHNLEKSSQGLYTWTTDQQIWQEQWQRKYKALSASPDEPLSYRQLTVRSYSAQAHPAKQAQITYQDILNEEIERSLHQPITIEDFMSPNQLMYPDWRPQNGYIAGVRQYDETMIVLSWIFVVPCEAMARQVIRFFSREEHRIKKQLAFVLLIITILLAELIAVYLLLSVIFCIDKFIAIKFMVVVYVIVLHGLLVVRVSSLRRDNAPGLIPFDVPELVAIWAVTRLNRASDKLHYYADKFKTRVVAIATKIKDWFIKIGNPLYMFICRTCNSLAEFVKLIVTKITDAIGMVFSGIGKVLQFIKDVVIGLGSGYLELLAGMMRFFLKFGRLGDLIFTPIALAYLGLPLILSYLFYWKMVAIIPAGILTTVLCLRGYKVLKSYQL